MGAYAERFDYGPDGEPERYWPAGRSLPVVVDPVRKFGRPTIAETSTTTEIIAEMASAGDAPDYLAAAYDFDPASVAAAIRFEHLLAAGRVAA